MGEIDDSHDAENQRKAASYEEQQRPVGNAIEGLNDPELRIHSPLNPSVIPKVVCELTLASSRVNPPNGRSFIKSEEYDVRPVRFSAALCARQPLTWVE